jgi:hypothetical protein
MNETTTGGWGGAATLLAAGFEPAGMEPSVHAAAQAQDPELARIIAERRAELRRGAESGLTWRDDDILGSLKYLNLAYAARFRAFVAEQTGDAR